MSSKRPLLAFLPLVFLCMAAFSQTARPVVASLPSDPLELATGSTMLLNTPENRTTVLGLLERARQSVSELYAPGGPAFSLKVSFTASGQSSYTGSGEMEEIRYNRELWRWSARLGNYSQLRIFQNGVPYDEKTPGPIPLRIQMVRGTVIWPMLRIRPGAAMRMAAGKWNGMDLMCALLSADDRPTNAPGREWQEREYCVDTKAGLLRIYSEAPGIYVTYDYSDAAQFHGRILARNISVSEEGTPVLQIHVDSLQDPGSPDPAKFTPTKEMIEHGPGIVLRAPIRFTDLAPSPSGYAGTVLPVIVHAAIDNDGKVVEAEALQNSEPNLSNAALTVVKRATYAARNEGLPLQREAFIEVAFGAAQ